MGTDLVVPDHTTLSRRTRGLKTALVLPWQEGPVQVFVDATGLGIVGPGQWAAARWGQGGRRGWKNLHIAVDATFAPLSSESQQTAPTTSGACTPPPVRVERAQSSLRAKVQFGPETRNWRNRMSM